MVIDKESRQILSKIADSQLIMAEAIKNINHNSTQIAECNKILTDTFIQHATQSSEEHKGFRDLMEKYWKLIIFLLIVVGALAGVKIVFPNL